MAVHFERRGAVLGLIGLAGAERMQQRPQDAAHMRVVVANQKSQLVEVDAIHGPALKGIPGQTVYPALTISRRRLMNGCQTGRQACPRRRPGLEPGAIPHSVQAFWKRTMKPTA